jgi:putative oxidoreductase
VADTFEQLMPYTPYFALLLRVVVGVSMVMHGYPKLKNPKPSVEWTKGMGVPAIATYLVIILEFFGGIALVIGLIVPIVAFFIALEMIGITVMKKTKMKATYLARQNGTSYEIDALYLLLAITLIVLGAGALSIDGILAL